MPFKTDASPYWQFNRRVTIDGKSHRVRGSTGTRNKREAERIEEQAVADYRAAILDPRPTGGLTLDECFGAYFDAVARHQPSWRATRHQARSLLAHFGGDKRIAAITTAELARFVAVRRATVANATVNRALEMLKRALRYVHATLGEPLPEIDWRALHLPEPAGRVRQLTTDEEKRLFAQLTPDLAALVRFHLATGCRVSSACNLEWRDLDFQARTITFRIMKGGKTHVVPMTSALTELLGNLPRVHARVFTYLHIGPRGPEMRPYLPSSWRHRWDTALERAKIEDFRRHDLRHTALSRITRTHGIRAAQRLAGHADISTTARYAHLELDDLREAMERSGQILAKPSKAAPKRRLKSVG